MNILSIIYRTTIDALFPLSKTEKELLSYTPIEAYSVLPSAPDYRGLATPLPEASSLFAYKDPRVTQLIWNIKYKKSSHAVAIGGYVLQQHIKKGVYVNSAPRAKLSAPSIAVVALPITARRRAERGYNQCDLLVDELERLDTEKHILILRDLLIRAHHDSRHTLKNRVERLKSAKGIFGVNEKVLSTILATNPDITHIPIIIVDDVITTGSTMREAIDTLKNAGFGHVYGLSLAH